MVTSKTTHAHAEISAIQQHVKIKNISFKRLHHLSGAEPCPMCLGAIYWAHLERLVFAADKNKQQKPDLTTILSIKN